MLKQTLGDKMRQYINLSEGKSQLTEGIVQSFLDLFRSKEDILFRKAMEELLNYHQDRQVQHIQNSIKFLKQEAERTGDSAAGYKSPEYDKKYAPPKETP